MKNEKARYGAHANAQSREKQPYCRHEILPGLRQFRFKYRDGNSMRLPFTI
jgi:hypothetical protein